MKTKYTAIYVRRSVSDKDKGNNSPSIAAQRRNVSDLWERGHPVDLAFFIAHYADLFLKGIERLD